MDTSLEDIIAEGTLFNLAGPATFERGEQYYEEGSVEFIVRDDNTISAIVSGTYDYKVKLWVKNGRLAHSCSCPVGERGEFCKHCVAVGLEWLNSEEDEEVQHPKSKPKQRRLNMDDVRRYLEGRDKNALIDIIINQAMDDDKLRESLMLKAAAVSPEGVNINEFREALDNALEPEEDYDRPYYDDYDEEGQLLDTEAVDRILDAVEELVDTGQAEAAIDLTEYGLKRVEDILDTLEYEDYSYDDVTRRLQDIHHSACLQTKPDPAELASKLFEWELKSEGNVFAGAAMDYADVLGEEGLARYRELAQAKWERVLTDEEDKSYPDIRSIMETLARQAGDIEALVEIKSTDLSAASDYLGIAKVYKDAGNPDLAIEWAERGVHAFPEDRYAQLRPFLIDTYREQGRHHDALPLAWSAFSKSPGLSNYQRLKECADPIGEWPQQREKALSLIREWNQASPLKTGNAITFWRSQADRSLLVEIFLWENDPVSALHEARDGGCTSELWLKLAEKLEDASPEDSISIYKTQISRTVDETNNFAYEKAVRLLHRVDNIMDRLGQNNEFGSYLQSLRSEFFRKRNFIKLLNAAKWK